MQTEINFVGSKVKKVEVNREDCLPEVIDPCYLSPTSQFLIELSDFNTRYDSQLNVQNSGKWAVGTYNLVKEIGVKRMFPTWNTKNGANAIHKFSRYNTWVYDKCIDDLKKLDSKLYEIRRAGIKLFSIDTANEGMDWIDNFNNRITKSLKTIKAHISYTNIPYFNRGRDGYSLLPIIYDTDCVIEDHIGHTYELSEEDEDKSMTYYPHEDMSLPQSWYFNILIPLKDIEISLNNSDGESKYKVHYGDLVVGMSIKISDLFALFMLKGNIRAFTQKISGMSNIGMFTYEFPYRNSMRHPFVSGRSARGNRITRSDFNRYDLGNTCFGDFKYELLQHIVSGNLSTAKGILDTWSTNFIINETSPLNQPQTFIFGMDKELKKNVPGAAINTSLCQDEVRNASDEDFLQEFMDEYCGKCLLVDDCSTRSHILLSKLKFEFDDDEIGVLGEWLPMYVAAMKYGSKSRPALCSTLHIAGMGLADIFRTDYVKVMNPKNWAANGLVYGETHKHAGFLTIEAFVYQLIPIAERVYAFNKIESINPTSHQYLVELMGTDDFNEKRKSNAGVFKLYNNLVLSNGGSDRVKPDSAYLDYCKNYSSAYASETEVDF